MKAGLILCCMRGADLREENMETIRQTAKYLGSGVCAADLAGAESLFPTEIFEDVICTCKAAGYPVYDSRRRGSRPGQHSLCIKDGRIPDRTRRSCD